MRTAAGGVGVGVVEHKSPTHQFVSEIYRGAVQVEVTLGIANHPDLHEVFGIGGILRGLTGFPVDDQGPTRPDFVGFLLVFSQVEQVREAGAASAIDPTRRWFQGSGSAAS